MLLIILLIIYIISFFIVRYVHRLHSSKHYDLWNDESCQLNFTWYIPIFNTLIAIFYPIFLYIAIQKIENKQKEPINKPKWKLFNWDL